MIKELLVVRQKIEEGLFRDAEARIDKFWAEKKKVKDPRPIPRWEQEWSEGEHVLYDAKEVSR